MIVKIENATSWNAPEGEVPLTLRSVFPVKSTGEARFVFEFTAPDNPHMTYLVGRKFKPSLDSEGELREALMILRGHDLTREELASQSVDLKSAIGCQVWGKIVHIENEGHKKPFVYLAELKPFIKEEAA
jgi:hypothetical protein